MSTEQTPDHSDNRAIDAADSLSLRALPAVHVVVAALQTSYPNTPLGGITSTTRAVIAKHRAAARGGQPIPTLDTIVEQVRLQLEAGTRPSLRSVLNASGVIIQTNLGRVPLSVAARSAINDAGAGYTNLEYDLTVGDRGSRSVHLAQQLTRLTGAEGALVVNNAAAALFFVLTVFASGGEVLLSRGQAVEIGGGFRIPDVLRQSGCRLVDVGTTNRTYASDYSAAITPSTTAILRVHSSNFRLLGFVHEPTLAELAAVSRAAKLMLIDDLGSGALLDTSQFGLAAEPTVQQSLAAGADMVVFSGDKLLGGPQAGIIVGRAAYLDQLANHALMRALRVDKQTIAGLAATLNAYERGTAVDELPLWQMISASVESLRQRAIRIAAGLAPAPAIVASACAVGGGSLPGRTLPGIALAFTPAHPDRFVARLRESDPPVIARIQAGHVLLELRSVLPEQDVTLTQVLRLLSDAG